MFHTPPQRIRRASAVALAGAAVALLLAAPARAADDVDWLMQLEDSISLGPSHAKPDWVIVWNVGSVPSMAEANDPFPTIVRDGSVIASAEAGNWLPLADLRTGDVIVIRDRRQPGYPELIRWTYEKKLGVDEPVCAGVASYSGPRPAGATNLSGSTARWVPAEPDPKYPSYPGDPGYPSYPGYPVEFYPGGAYGWTARDASMATVTAVGSDRLKFVPGKKTVAGMRLTVGASFTALPKLGVTMRSTQTVVDCPKGPVDPTPTPAPTPQPTPAPTTPPVVPGKDTKPPLAALAGLTNAKLKSGGRRSLINKGLPFTLTVDEPGRLVGTVKLVTGKKSKLLKKVDSPLKAGRNSLRLKWTKAGKRRLRAASRKAKLKLAFTVIDAAGNKRALKSITVKLPR